MDIEQHELIEQARKYIYTGADHLEVQRALKEMHISNQQIREVLAVIEPDFVKYQLADQERTKILNQVLVGAFVLIIGTGVTAYSLITVGYVYRTGYGLLLSGAWWTFRNFQRYRQPIESFITVQEFMRKRRFRK
ncbi:MAG: hypothetical protein IPL46_24170 [Saprospiraceae bacterium]|nr:hypothetical protein [Saprospiraceae bacterium]